MKHSKHRFLSLLVVCALMMTCLLPTASASGASAASTDRADKLLSLHLFQGAASGYQLDKAPTRMQGLVMLIRLLGEEEEALACTEANPFADLTWGQTYGAYAYAKGLTRGTSATTFTPNSPLNAKSYAAFLLRALGYDDGAGDFTVGDALTAAAAQSLMTPEAAAKLPTVSMNRGDMVDLSYAALTCKIKGGTGTLAEKLCADGVFTQAEGQAAGVLGEGAGWVYTYEAPILVAPAGPNTPAVSGASSGVSYEKKTVTTSAGKITAHVLTVDTRDPAVTVKTALVGNTIGATAPFSQIVETAGSPVAVMNGNFFNSYSDFKCPIGHVMVNGEFLYGSSGITSLGITKDGEIRVGRPALFTRIQAEGNTSWTAYEINVAAQSATNSILYTKAYGKTVPVTKAGSVLTVVDGAVTSFDPVAVGGTITIPAGGFAVYMGASFTATEYFIRPIVGTPVTLQSYLNKEDAEGFTLEGLSSVVSGAPRLVQDSVAVTTLEPGFTEARFTTNSSPRTAIGVNAAGKLVMVSVPAATIQQMRALMLALGCVDAFNLDGGASCGMYYDGAYLAKPGRELTVTLQVFVKK